MLQNKLSGDLAAVRLLVYALILIVAVIFNNAPALKSVRERFKIKPLTEKLFKKKPGRVKDDEAEWGRVESKIKMDTILTVDLPHNGDVTPDKPPKEGK